MLKKVQSKFSQRSGCAYAIVASRYNGQYVDSMLRAAKAELKAAGASEVRVYRVPGSYEIPVVAARLARQAAGADHPNRLGAILCLGVILRGETTHAAHIGEAVSDVLMKIQVETEIPVIHEVLLLENHDQARVRCLSKEHNRGREAAQTAVAMAELMRKLDGERPRTTDHGPEEGKRTTDHGPRTTDLKRGKRTTDHRPEKLKAES
jgi:6,7-dimethyl-8-ribityllumazine synthase